MPGDSNKEYLFDLEIQPDENAEAYGVHVYVIPGEDGTPARLKISANAGVEDAERILASSLEALEVWWNTESSKSGITQERRDPSFTDKVWTPFT